MIITPDMERIAQIMIVHAASGTFDGRQASMRTPYFLRSFRRLDSGLSIGFIRDVGMHQSGWFKNPDYDQCWHLSMTFFEPGTDKVRPFEFIDAEAWVRAFYRELVPLVWHEGPSQNAPAETHHYRVMTNEHWQPILPRLEVYSTDFTEKGWKSFSEAQADAERRRQRTMEKQRNE